MGALILPFWRDGQVPIAWEELENPCPQPIPTLLNATPPLQGLASMFSWESLDWGVAVTEAPYPEPVRT